MSDDLILVGAIMGAHGLKGEVKVKVFADSFKDYSVFYNETEEKTYVSKGARGFKGDEAILLLEGIVDRTQAERLKGTKLFVERDQLATVEEEDVYYVADLIGYTLTLETGELLGIVTDVHNYGASDILEFEGGRVPFHKEAAPSVDKENQNITVVSSFVIRD